MIVTIQLLKTLTRLHYLINIISVQFLLNTVNLDLLIPESSQPTTIDSIHITPDEAHAELCHFECPDNITPFLLKSAVNYAQYFVTDLFNM